MNLSSAAPRSTPSAAALANPALGDLAADDVQRRAGLEPLDLLRAERVDALERDHRSVRLDDLAAHVLPGLGRQIQHVDPIALVDQVVGGRIRKRQRDQSLLLEVRLVDAGEAARQDDDATAEPWLHRRVLA